ncbi:hypothetical protein ACFFRR_007509 [Megaselia abdita]
MFGKLIGTFKGFRYVQTVFLFLSIVYSNFSEKNVTIAIVEMTNMNSTDIKNAHFDWAPDEKQYVLSSFYIGFILFHIPGGYLAKRFGSKNLSFIAIFGSSSLNLIIPVLVKYGGWQVFMGVRLIQGFLQALILPSCLEHLMNWVPKQEENIHTTLCFSGFDFGTTLGIGIAGAISASSLGWPFVFYVTGAMGLTWSLGWIIIASNSPLTSKYLSTKEQDYIFANQTGKNLGNTDIPWKSILTSLPCIAVFVSYTSIFWGYLTMICETSIYLNAVFKFDADNNTLISALPNGLCYTTGLISIFISEFLMRKNYLSVRKVRILLNCFGMFLPALIFIALAFITSNDTNLAIGLIIACIGLMGPVQYGCGVAMIDIAPNFASVIIGIQMALASIPGFVVPVVVSLILGDEEQDLLKWRIVFLLSAGIVIFGNIIFILFGSSKEAEWNAPKAKDVKDGNEIGNKS